MNDYERENMAAWGRTAAAYLNKDAGVLEVLAIDSLIEGEHTRYIVGRNTGDARLARMAGNSAILTYWYQLLLVFVVPFLVFLAGCAACYVLGKGIGVSPGVLAALWALPCVGLVVWMAYRIRDMRNGEYIRANLPTERTLNRAGYYEVEPDVWFNMITNRVLEGRCYRPAEQAASRQVARTESQQIRDLYRNRGHHNAPRRRYVSTPTTSAIEPASDKGWTGLGR